MGVLANPAQNIPPYKGSKDYQWIEWYKELYDTFGKSISNQLFIKAFNNRGGDANTSTLREFVKPYGVVLTADSVFGSITDLSKDAIGSVIDDVGGFLKMGKIGTIAVGTTALVCVVILVIGISKHPQSFTEIMKPPVI